MKDQLEAIKDEFIAYSIAFNSLEPTKVLEFFHLPAMLMTSEKVAIMEKQIEVLGVFAILMDGLKEQKWLSRLYGVNGVKCSDSGILSPSQIWIFT